MHFLTAVCEARTIQRNASLGQTACSSLCVVHLCCGTDVHLHQWSKFCTNMWSPSRVKYSLLSSYWKIISGLFFWRQRITAIKSAHMAFHRQCAAWYVNALFVVTLLLSMFVRKFIVFWLIPSCSCCGVFVLWCVKWTCTCYIFMDIRLESLDVGPVECHYLDENACNFNRCANTVGSGV